VETSFGRFVLFFTLRKHRHTVSYYTALGKDLAIL
jgi:hypothetical protein